MNTPTNPTPKPTLAQALANASAQLRALVSHGFQHADHDTLDNLAGFLKDASEDAAKLEATQPQAADDLGKSLAAWLTIQDPGKDSQGAALRGLGLHYGEATDEESRAAFGLCDDEIELCETGLVSRSDEGTWILGWLWTVNKDADEGDDTPEREPDRDTDQHGNTYPAHDTL